VTDRVKDVLHLEPEETQRVCIATFGTSKGGTQSLKVVRLGMRLDDGVDKELKLIAVPNICEPLTAQPISLCLERYSHLKQLKLADSSTGHDLQPWRKTNTPASMVSSTISPNRTQVVECSCRERERKDALHT